MGTTAYTSAAGTVSTYRYEVGPIDWNGKKMNAVIIGGLPLEGGAHVDRVISIVASRILAENQDILAKSAVWAIFVKSPRRMPVAEWRLVGSGSGRQPFPEGEAPSNDIPEIVVRQLEGIFRE